MKKFNNAVVNGYNGKPIMWNIDGKVQELKTVNAFFLVLNNYKMMSQKDSIEGSKLAIALDKVVTGEDEIISIEEGTHDWFKLIAERLTPGIFGVNGNVVYMFVKEGFAKDKEKEDNKRGRT